MSRTMFVPHFPQPGGNNAECCMTAAIEAAGDNAQKGTLEN